MAELGGSQISSLMETLPGIAQVLRSPVADAIVHLSRAAARLEEFRPGDSEELLQFAVRRSLMTQDEADRVLEEVQAAHQKRVDRAAAKTVPASKAGRGAKATARRTAAKPKVAAKAKKSARPVKKPARPARQR